MPHSRFTHGIAAACAAGALVGCGGGAPLLHPAHPLAKNVVTAGAGVSGQFLVGDGVRDVRPPQRTAAGGEEQTRLESLAREASLAPGVAPWVGGRIGLGGNTEAGFSYLGRSLRIDARKVFGDETWALSVGAGASGVLMHVDNKGNPPPGLAPAGRVARDPEVSATGWGFDVPVLVGYRSTASVAQIWLGARGGVERIWGEIPLTPLVPTPAAGQDPNVQRYGDVSALRWYGGGLIGAAIGFRPFWVALELDVAYQFVTAKSTFDTEPRQVSLDLSGITLAPSGAIIGKF